MASLVVIWCALGGTAGPSDAVTVRVPVSRSSEIDITELIVQLAQRAGVEIERPSENLRLPATGLAGTLTRELLCKTLGARATVTLTPRELSVSLPGDVQEPERRAELERGLNELARKVRNEAVRRSLRYGMHARSSYRPNDPARPTICLVHGLNSSAEVFVHMVGPLEEAGFGLVIYEFPYNRDLDETSQTFCRDWAEFRRQRGEKRPWTIVAHSLGGLLARTYVEADPGYAGDVGRMILIAPPNQGSSLAKAQTMLQLMQGVQAINGRKGQALAHLSDGLGEAADDMLPGSPYLKTLNSHGRREGVAYHILAGDGGPLNSLARKQIEIQLETLGKSRGLLGGLTRLAADDLRSRLDELTEGLGDGCVSVASTKLDGVIDHQVTRANHLELIRAPLLYPEPGPVASMPYILRWLSARPERAKEARR